MFPQAITLFPAISLVSVPKVQNQAQDKNDNEYDPQQSVSPKVIQQKSQYYIFDNPEPDWL
jgi:hypothetical protein